MIKFKYKKQFLSVMAEGEARYVMVNAVVRLNKVDAVKDALINLGHRGMTVVEVRGHGQERGGTAIYRGKEYNVPLLPKAKLEVAVPEVDVPRVLEEIVIAARTGEIGDGRIWTYPIYNYRSIRTGKTE